MARSSRPGPLRAVDRAAAGRLGAGAALCCAAALLGLAAAAEPAEVRITGSNTIGEALMPALISGYAQSQGLTLVRRPDPADPERETLEALFGVDEVLRIALERRGSATAFAALLEETALIGMSSRAIKEDEEKALARSGAASMTASESEHVIARDGLTAVVARDNPLRAISLGDLARVFSGDIDDWSALGLPAGPIRVHARDDRSGAYDAFADRVLAPAGAALTGRAERHVSNERLVAAVAADPRAIGFSSLAAAQNAEPVAIALSCGIVVRPNKFSVKAEEYPLGRRLYLYSRGAPDQPDARALLDYAASDAAQPIIDAVGFVDHSIQQADAVDASERLINGMREARTEAVKQEMRRFIEAARGATRLSPTFRFQHGKDLLDDKAFADAGRLARWLSLPDNASRRILLAGFSDGSGSFETNKDLTLKRAEAVRRALLVQVSSGFDSERVLAAGFGPAAPIACDDDPGGEVANRRVEVWMLP